jgi:VCBS repeat-containing protein
MLSLNANVIDGTSETGTITWSFDSGSEAFDYLAVGESLTLTYTVQVSDSQGATDTQEVTISVTGTNDAPIITVEAGDSAGETLSVTGATLTSSGSLSVVDLDRSDVVTAP